MAGASKRAKGTDNVKSKTGTSTDVILSGILPTSIPFQTGPSLEHLPDDVFLEILSHLPALQAGHVELDCFFHPPVIPPHFLMRTPILRVLSRTSKLLRSRCLPMAWQNLELCVSPPQTTFYKVIGEIILAHVHVLKACPYLLPLIQAAVVCLTRYKSAEMIPLLAECLATLPNLNAIHVMHAHAQMSVAIKNGFEGKRFPTVRKISLPSSAHEIIKCCPNLEEVICTNSEASPIIGSLVKGGCNQVHTIKCVHYMSQPQSNRLAKFLPGLRYIGLSHSWSPPEFTQLTSFPLLDTIEVDLDLGDRRDSKIQSATKVLKENKSEAEKRVIVTQWYRQGREIIPYPEREVIQV